MKKDRAARGIQRAAEALELPGEPGLGVPRVTVTGGSRVHVENHRGLLEYGPEAITVNAGTLLVKVRGSGLEIEAMSDMELVVSGTVRAVEFVS